MTPADKIAAAGARALFELEAARADEAVNLARAALLIAAEEEPRRVDLPRCLARLDEMGEEARARMLRGGDDGAVEALNRYLFEEQDFSGNESNYYDPRNSLLNHVLSTRRGIPITLSIVYMEVARRAGVGAEGVGLPGHFIVRARAEGARPVLVDPFYGRHIDREECQRRLDAVYEGKVRLTDEHLRAVGARAILARVLGNLKAIYVQAQLYRRALAAVERILLLTPDDPGERRDRAMLLAQLGRLPEAIADAQAYLALTPQPPDADAVREQLKKMRLRAALLN